MRKGEIQKRKAGEGEGKEEEEKEEEEEGEEEEKCDWKGGGSIWTRIVRSLRKKWEGKNVRKCKSWSETTGRKKKVSREIERK